ncbi:glutamate ABC transporter substrate-binding protein [Parafrankia sp. BMG5.11]|uniref:glutamate ABC transporter substrate-binding protein n=2 Tax=unclassified Parafrankia TaxID=2994368 RepID=UPI001FB3550D|nr:glutamate ABC transporter substrate-binding protein [Parafrankia sp. BMG5.11]
MTTADGISATSVITRRTPASRALLMLVGIAVLLGACGTVDNPLPEQARAMPAAGATPNSTAPASATPSAAGDCGDPTASLRPPTELPSPGAMPAGSHLETVAQRGYLTAGVLADVPPFGFIDPFSGEFAGFDVDMARLIGRAIFGEDGHVRFRAVTYPERIPVLRDGTVDVVVATMTTNCERRAQVDFSAVYYEEANRVLVPTDSPYQGMEDLGGRRVCTAAGTTTLDHIRNADPRPVAVAAPTIGDCLVELQAGTVDAITTTEAILAGMVSQDPRVHIVGPRLTLEPDAIGVSLNHPDLTRFVNGVLAQAIADGSWNRLAQTWLPGLSPTPPTPTYRG